MRYDYDHAREALATIAGHPVDTQQISAIRLREMIDWPTAKLHEFEERAAFLEFSGGMKRGDAHAQAYDDVRWM